MSASAIPIAMTSLSLHPEPEPEPKKVTAAEATKGQEFVNEKVHTTSEATASLNQVTSCIHLYRCCMRFADCRS